MEKEIIVHKKKGMARKIVASLSVVLFVLLISLAIGYYSYKQNTSEQNYEPEELYVKDESGELIPIGSPEEVIKNVKDNRKGASNPALEFRNKSDPATLLYYFDHDGKIMAFNLTLEGNFVTAGNATASTGFFTYLGDSTNKITTGWITSIYASFINSTNVSSTYYGNGSNWYEISDFLNDTTIADTTIGNCSTTGSCSTVAYVNHSNVGDFNVTGDINVGGKVCYDATCTTFRNATGEYWNSGSAYMIWNGSTMIARA